MWIEHIGEIMIGVFVILIAAHFGLHFWMKYQKRKMQKSNTDVSDQPPSNTH